MCKTYETCKTYKTYKMYKMYKTCKTYKTYEMCEMCEMQGLRTGFARITVKNIGFTQVAANCRKKYRLRVGCYKPSQTAQDHIRPPQPYSLQQIAANCCKPQQRAKKKIS